MFTVNQKVKEARKLSVQSLERPKIGTVLRTINGRMPVRVHCQLARGSEVDIFAYATLQSLNTDLTATGQRWFLRDLACTDPSGTKVVLTAKTRDRLLKAFDGHPVFEDCDVLPVMALRVTKISASGRSVEAEIAEMATKAVVAVCSDYAKIMLDPAVSDDEKRLACDEFYRHFEEPATPEKPTISDETRTASEGAAA